MPQVQPLYSTKASQPGVIDQLWDIQKYGRSAVSYIGRTTNATPTELAIDNESWTMPQTGTVLFNRLLIPRNSLASVTMRGGCFDVTTDNNAGSGEGNSAFTANFAAININGTVAFLPAGAPTVTILKTVGAGSPTLAWSAGTDGLILTATGIAARVINWHVSCDYSVVTFKGSPINGADGI